MSTSKHPKSGSASGVSPADDLDRNPGIGAGLGTTRAGGATHTHDDPEAIVGANTIEGDVMNDVEPDGSVDPNRRGRTNR
jgi:hypothetical protein